MLAKMNSEVNGIKDSMKKLDHKFDAVASKVCQENCDGRFPAQPEQNPKAQCGAISTCAATTKAGTSTSPIQPTRVSYVPPHVRGKQKYITKEAMEGIDTEKEKEEVANKGRLLEKISNPARTIHRAIGKE
jgi:hypothetical protein